MLDASDGPLLSVFSAVARLGSFSAAATSLKLSKSVVSERVKQLEERCGVRLIERTTRRLRLTRAGDDVLSAATGIDEVLGLLSRRLDDDASEPSGTLRISTTNDLGPLLVGPVAARLITAFPKVNVEITADDAALDLVAAGIDVAVRLGAPRSSTFVSRKLAVLQEPIVAAPSLAGTLGPVTRPRALAAAPWVRHALIGADSMRFTGPGGRTEKITPTFRAEANTGATLLSLLLHRRAARARAPRAHPREEARRALPGLDMERGRALRAGPVARVVGPDAAGLHHDAARPTRA